MSRKEKTIAHILEIAHPVLLAALAGPVFYTLREERADEWILPMYLMGFSLLPLSAAVRAAVRKVRSMWVFLLISGAVLALTIEAGRVLTDAVVTALAAPEGAGQTAVQTAGQNSMTQMEAAARSQVPGTIVMAELILGGIWITMSALRLRIRENRRERARLENDITWQERGILAEKPRTAFLVLFVGAYLAGLLNACPPTCNIALGGGIAYLMAALAYRSFEVADGYLRETQNLINVPRAKISLLRRRMLAAVLGVLVVLSASAFVTAGGRRYRDLRKWEWEAVEVETEAEEYGNDGAGGDMMEDITPALGEGEVPRETPAWLKALEAAVMTAVLVAASAAIGLFIWRAVSGAAREFAAIPEENGDVARSLDDITEDLGGPDSVLSRIRQALSGKKLTEKEQIRREYRRAIRKYRKTDPGRSETPAQIESAAVFPEDFDAVALHEKYERARYG